MDTGLNWLAEHVRSTEQIVGTTTSAPLAPDAIRTGQSHTGGVPPADQEHSLFLQPSETWLLLEPEVGLPGGIVALQATHHQRYPM